MSADAAPPILRDHLVAVTTDAELLRGIWAPDGVLEFPYAEAVGVRRRIEGIDALVEYFDGPRRFADWRFSGFRTITADDGAALVVEFHGAATVLASGNAYEQDYISILRLTPEGRIAHLREYWDPTRVAT
jgi:hypothetical protein